MTQLELTDIDTDTDDTGETFVVVTRGASKTAMKDNLRACVAAANTVTDSSIGARSRTQLISAILAGEVKNPVQLVDDGGDGELMGLVGWSCRESTEAVEAAVTTAVRENHQHLVVDSFATLGRSVPEIRDRIETAVDGGVAVHVVSQGLDVTEDTADVVLGVLDGLDAVGPELAREASMRDVQAWTGGFEQTRGRAPLGFEYRDGELVTAENFDEVRAVLKRVDDGDEGLSKRRAADRLDASPRTISRAIEEHRDRYGLDEPVGAPSGE